MTIPKFRAWHKQRKKMAPVYNLFLNPEWGGAYVHIQADDNHIFDTEYWTWSDIELMQFTTLNNDTNQEIWQGDICRHKEDTENGRLHEQYEVYWSEDRWGLRHIERKEDYDNGSYYQAYEINWHEWEVIGNIYQHPHLLQSKEPLA